MATFDSRLKKLREEKNISQTQLAEDLGVTKGTISVWERGIRKPDFDKMEKIAAYFDTTLQFLLGNDANRSQGQVSDETAAKWEMDDEEEILNEFMKKFVRLGGSSQNIIKAAINQAYKEDLANDRLQPEDIYVTKVTATWRLKERQRMKKKE